MLIGIFVRRHTLNVVFAQLSFKPVWNICDTYTSVEIHIAFSCASLPWQKNHLTSQQSENYTHLFHPITNRLLFCLPFSHCYDQTIHMLVASIVFEFFFSLMKRPNSFKIVDIEHFLINAIRYSNTLRKGNSFNNYDNECLELHNGGT